MDKVIVTGVNGFVGDHLASALLESGFRVVGVGREDQPNDPVAEKLDAYIKCDLTDYVAVDQLPLDQAHALINLAGLAAVGPSFDQPDLYMQINTAVLDSVCKAAIKQGASLRILSISSGAVYSNAQPMPLIEDSILNKDSSPYAASKIAMEELSLKYRDAGLDCIVARPFNHIGPGQGPGFLLPDLFLNISRLSKGEKLHVGNLATKRDYTDVRDVVRAYVGLATADELRHGIYNVCSGKPLSGEQVLSLLLESMGRSDVTTIVDKSLFRPTDAQELYGDNTRLRTDTGWEPSISLEHTIDEFVSWVTSQ